MSRNHLPGFAVLGSIVILTLVFIPGRLRFVVDHGGSRAGNHDAGGDGG